MYFLLVMAFRQRNSTIIHVLLKFVIEPASLPHTDNDIKQMYGIFSYCISIPVSEAQGLLRPPKQIFTLGPSNKNTHVKQDVFFLL